MGRTERIFPDKYIDLHLHLDGAVTSDIAKHLADMQGIELPAEGEALEKLLSVGDDCKDLNEFLECFELPLKLLQTAEALEECAFLVAEKMREQGVIYAEVRFAPQLHCEKELTQRDAVKAVIKGLSRSELKTGLILCCMRGEGIEEKNLKTAELAEEYLGKGVCALDLAGAEGLFPTENYAELFAKVRESGVPFTIHAGEADGAKSVRKAIEFGAARIGHGVRIYEDPELVSMIAERGIPLEMCPNSNRLTHAVENMEKYPFTEYLRRGIKVTINTDDPAIERTDIAAEFRYMERRFGLTAEQKRQVLLNAADASFAAEDIKKMLRDQIAPGVNEK
ncbi:adenosine deaminase [Ruminococcus albus SY3]|uniref:adenosine deaminase n=1 Tax=Ruminococcus albus SY3 TaxID=1341156 RepID=A0A011VYE3_RUMAL|nr:adenosine deaminase [Ruminococcus albus]EXM40341.1 adenosine deaminase [Ruminococcus albus SY3]